ncbi:hypothetical protein PoMZ_05700 [Pyricularia oryzae]|uniref:Uncharacterized protein n=1 Tax=Pyricularia oryzae TaxID=318829 RepID=A0A4P7NP64_PYROR|nr:hypothetical protein PoMZ_05700 [Pyricularia oryzae]
MHFHTLVANLVVVASLGAAHTLSAEQPINQLLSQDILQFRGMAKGRKSSKIDCDKQDNGGMRRPITACIRTEAEDRPWYLASQSNTVTKVLRRDEEPTSDTSGRRGAAKLSKKNSLPKSAELRDPAPSSSH